MENLIYWCITVCFAFCIAAMAAFIREKRLQAETRRDAFDLLVCGKYDTINEMMINTIKFTDLWRVIRNEVYSDYPCGPTILYELKDLTNRITYKFEKEYELCDDDEEPAIRTKNKNARALNFSYVETVKLMDAIDALDEDRKREAATAQKKKTDPRLDKFKKLYGTY